MSNPSTRKAGRFASALLPLIAALAGVALPQSGGEPHANSPTPRKPNIVLIISDDHGWTDYGFMGHPQVTTPRLDQLAAQSLVFRRGYVPSSVCCPSLASIITGLYPHQTKVCCNSPPHPDGTKWHDLKDDPAYREQAAQAVEMSKFLENQPTLPRALATIGYTSFQTGKWWQGSFTTAGFTQGMTTGAVDKGGGHGDEGLRIGRETMQPICDFIEQAGEQPWFLWYAPLLPHLPHDPPQRLLDKYTARTPSLFIARYWAMIEWLDETCGALLDFLDRKKLADDTIVVFLSDNGWIAQPNTPEVGPGSKSSSRDGGLRTPILIRWPGHVKPREVDTPVMSIDLAPTLLHACGLPPDPAMQGVDLLSDAAVQGRKAIFGECFTYAARDIHSPAANVTYRWCIADGRWKLILPNPANLQTPKHPERKPQPELFDVAADPHEEKELAAAEPARVAELTQLIDAWWSAKE